MTRPAPGSHWLDRAEGRRLFVAVPLGEEARAAVARLMAEVGGVAPVGGRDHTPAPPSERGPGRERGRHPRWVRPESLHLTLRFVGATPDDAVPELVAAVDEAAAGVATFECTLAAAGAFPPGPRPRVLWIGAGEGAEALAALAARLEDALAARGWPRDDRPFNAHLTIARTDGVATALEVADRLRERAATLAARWRADRIVLFESVTGGGPAHYLPVHVAALRATVVTAEPPTG